MILSDRMIKAARETGDIVIEPFNPKALGTNSYDVHLGDTLLTYRSLDGVIDARVDNKTDTHLIDSDGFVLQPGILYLGSTVEYTETHKHVPFLDGKSSVGRLGITIHCTAGRGDVLWKGHWTMEIHVIQPVRVYAHMPIAQLIYFETGEVDVPYDSKASAKYRDGRNKLPQASRMWMNFQK